MSDLHKSDPDSPYADDLEFVRDYARRNNGYALVQPVVDFINAHPAPQIIRTVEELEALGPETLVWPARHYGPYAAGTLTPDPFYPHHTPPLPAEQVRAARKALEES
jgi:hypothetical protein